MYDALDARLRTTVDALVEHGRTALWPERRAALASVLRGIATSDPGDQAAAAQALALDTTAQDPAGAIFQLILTAYLEHLAEDEITNPDQAALYSLSLDDRQARLAAAWFEDHPEHR